MRLAQSTRGDLRYTIDANRAGLTTGIWRPRVGGGWYPKHAVTFPWPFGGAS